jgi:ABC-type multidrug transport system ATPase subunit
MPLNDVQKPSEPIYSKKGSTYYKQILTNISGCVKPKEMVAIMGPSGSGKTSLLNFLAQRLALSPGCKYDGDVIANGRKVNSNDFGKFGAFVQ